MTNNDIKKVVAIVEAIANIVTTMHQTINYEEQYDYSEDLLWQWRARLWNWVKEFDSFRNNPF